MNALLIQFIQETRDFLQGIAEKLIELESAPDSSALMTELFRLVHTLKGNSGLFDFPEMTRTLHAAEDLMDAVRDGRVAYSQALADSLLNAMDFVSLLIDEIEANGVTDPGHAALSGELAQGLRRLIPTLEAAYDPDGAALSAADAETPAAPLDLPLPALADIPEPVRLAAWRAAAEATPLFLIGYRPEAECFFKGEDPFHQARQMPGLLWGEVRAQEPWPKLAELDCYSCKLDFFLLVAGPRAEIDQYFRYTPEQVRIERLDPLSLVIPGGASNDGPIYGDFVDDALALLEAGDRDGLAGATRTLLELSAPELWLCSVLRWLLAVLETTPGRTEVLRRLIAALNGFSIPDFSDLKAADAARPEPAPTPVPDTPRPLSLNANDRSHLEALLATQADILDLPDGAPWLDGRLKAVAATLSACCADLGETNDAEIRHALDMALAERSSRPLREWLTAFRHDLDAELSEAESEREAEQPVPKPIAAPAVQPPIPDAALDGGNGGQPVERPPAVTAEIPAGDGEIKFGRRAEDALIGKVLKVDQAKVDRLMSLIGEMVVAKNSLPYLANRAENQYGVRELSREIKAQYAVINRIAEEMQDAIMQVRMMPVSFIFQRFPRLVRDISRKLGKEVDLVLEGEDTEADKNIIEALADPLIHIVRNSLDHGLEAPEARLAAGKPRAGRLVIRARQESDRAVIEIIDDGRGIDPAAVKRKAYEKGLIDEAQLERIGDQEAVNLIFAPGFSMAEAITDLSGRGVGMDVVRGAVDRVGGVVELRSEVGKGTTLRLSLPLSMAVTNVMIIESDRQIFGVPMDLVVETVRLPAAEIRLIKRKKTTVLRGRIVPLVALNELLEIPAEPTPNADDELAALVVRVGNEQVGLLVDDFREVVDVILKPMPGELAKLRCYAGTALLGDGSVLMVLNPKELF